MINKKLKAKLKKIKLVISDVDGVLTDNLLYISEDAVETKIFCVADGIGIRMLQKTGVIFAVISGRSSIATQLRMSKVGVKYVFQNQSDKTKIYHKLLDKLDLTDEQVLVIGDDLPDLPIMKKCGVKVAVPNAYPIIKSIADIITKTTGGKGAIRELCEIIMKAQNKIEDGYDLYI